MKNPFLFLLVSVAITAFYSSQSCFAQVESIADGVWTQPEIWSTGQVPGPDDDVIIRDSVNFPFTYFSTIRVRNLTILGQGRNANLLVHNSNIGSVVTDLEVSGNLTVESRGAKALFDARIYAGVSIGGDVTIIRNHPAQIGDSCAILLQGYSKVNVAGNFTVNYLAGGDGSRELRVNRAALNIAGDLTFRNSGGFGDLYLEVFSTQSGVYSTLTCRDLVFDIPNIAGGFGQDLTINVRQNSIVNVTRDFILTNSGRGDINLGLGLSNSTGFMNVARNAAFTTSNIGTITFSLRQNSKWELEGNVAFNAGNATNLRVLTYENSQINFGGTISPSLPGLNIFNFAPTVAANSLVVFDGDSEQVIPGNETYCRLVTDNVAGFELTGNIVVKNQLSMVNGRIIAADKLVDLQGPGYSASSAAYICNGYLRRALVAGGATHWFHIGDTVKGYSPAAVSNLTSAATFEAKYFPVDPEMAGYSPSYMDYSLAKVSNLEYWMINRVAGASEANVHLGWNAYSSVNDSAQNSLRIVHWNGEEWRNLNDCIITGNADSGGVASTIFTVPAFSPFTLASITPNNFIVLDLKPDERTATREFKEIAQEIHVCPNSMPLHASIPIRVQLPDELRTAVTLRVVSMNGREVWKQPVSNGQKSIFIYPAQLQLSCGLYVIQMGYNGKNYSGKIVMY